MLDWQASVQFQSTHSVRSATRRWKTALNFTMFQSTHSVRSATNWAAGVRPVFEVSIHALRAECDADLMAHAGLLAFQSTHSVRSATKMSIPPQGARCRFNPRTPCGVRLGVVAEFIRLCLVSIHALRAECDRTTSL